MKHKYLWLLVIVVAVAAIFPLRLIVGGNEDTWICTNNTWVKHGNPLEPMPGTGCGPSLAPTIVPTEVRSPDRESSAGKSVGLANPASVYCEEQKGTSKIVTAADGSQSGMCVFSDGRQCDEWNFFRTKVCK